MGRRLARLKNSRPRLILVVLYLYAMTIILNLLCWIIYVRDKKYSLSQEGSNAYIAFTCLGFAFFFFFCAPLMYLPYAHGNEMSPDGRRDALSLALAICLIIHGLPMMWIEITIVWEDGFTEIMQGVSLFLTVFSFVIGMLSTWINYTWKMSKILQVRYGTASTSDPTVRASSVAKKNPTARI